jgi:hypothetical protein
LGSSGVPQLFGSGWLDIRPAEGALGPAAYVLLVSLVVPRPIGADMPLEVPGLICAYARGVRATNAVARNRRRMLPPWLKGV